MRVNYSREGIFSRVSHQILDVERGEKEDGRKKEKRKGRRKEEGVSGGRRKRLSARLRDATSGMDNA